MINERSDGIGVAKIHAQRDAGVFQSSSIEIWHVDRIAQERLVHRDISPSRHKEVKLVDVEGVEFGGTIFDDPIFHVALMDDDIRNIGSGVEGLGGLTFHC